MPDGTTPTPIVTPLNGYVTIVAAVAGEETFIDNNANGYYDSADTFNSSADLPEPFIDENSNGQWDTGEIFIDTVTGTPGTTNIFNSANGVWDGPNCPDTSCQQSKTIWKSIELIFSGNAQYCEFSQPSGFSLAKGEILNNWFMVADKNLNPLVPGTTITVTANHGTLSGTTNYTVPDGGFGPTQINFKLTNDTAGGPFPTTITVTVNGATVSNTQGSSYKILGCNGGSPVTISGTLN